MGPGTRPQYMSACSTISICAHGRQPRTESGVGAGGDDIRGREPDEEQEHADDPDMNLLLHGPRVQPAGAGAVAPSADALRSPAGPVMA